MTKPIKDGARDGDLRPIQPEKAIPSDAEVRAQADNLAQDIDVAAQDTGAIIEPESPQAVELAGLVADSKAGAEAIVADQSDTKAQEHLEFDYSSAESWDELYSQIKQRMGAVDANHVIEAINLFRETKINERDLPVTPDSHIIEAAVKLKLYDIADGKKFTPKVVDKIEVTQESVSSAKPITEAAPPVTEPVPVPPEPAPEPIPTPTPEPVPISEAVTPEKVENESQKIELSGDPEKLSRLRDKLKDYKRRLAVENSQYVRDSQDLWVSPNGGPVKRLVQTADTRCKIAVLEKLLLTGSVDKHQFWEELANSDKIIDQSIYDNAFFVIGDYVMTGGERVVGGAGLISPNEMPASRPLVQDSEKELPVTPAEEKAVENKVADKLVYSKDSSASPDEKPMQFETKFDVRDAGTKGKINKFKIFLDKLNRAANRSDDPEKITLLGEASILLDNPNLAKSADLGLAIEEAHLALENKIRALEIEIKTAQLERLIDPLKDLIKEINSVKSRETKLAVLQKAAQLLNQPDFATAILQKSKEEQDLLVPDALEGAVLLAEAKIRKIEEEINKLRTSSEPGTGSEVEPAQPLRALPETPEPNPEPVPTPEPVPVSEPVMPKKVEKDLGYLDIDPKAIWEKLTPQDMEALHALMKNGDAVKINEFYQVKIKEVLVDQKKEASANEELMKQMAESVNNIIQRGIELDAERQLLESGGLVGHMLDAKKGKRRYAVAKIARSFGIMAVASGGIAALGIGTGGVAIAASALGMTLVRFAMRKIEANRKETKPASVTEKEKQAEAENLTKKKAEILETIFSPDNLEKLERELSGHISNVLRVQTSERALKALREYEQADGIKEPEVAGAKLREVEKQLYLNALTRMRAEYPDVTPEQQQNMALTLALTLGSHEKGENLAKQRLDDIKKSKPDLYRRIEKFNLLNVGSPDKKPAGMSKEEESTWYKYKYDMLSLGIGWSVGMAIRKVGPMRIAMGAVAGAGLGYKLGEWMEKRDEKKALAEIVKMIDESEEVIKDIEFPTDQLDKLKQDSILVKSKLDLGLLEGNPLLKSRAENFIHQVQKIELANQVSLQKLLESVSQRTDKQSQQLEDDLNRIGGKIKNRKLWTTIGGAVVGGGLAWLAGELTHKEKEDGVHKLDDGDSKDIDNLSNKRPEINTIGASAVEPGASITEQVKAPEFPMESEVHSGDSVWKLAEEQLKQRYGHDKWDAFGEARQTHMIDEIKDQVAANREAFGLHHDVDDLRVGEKIDFSPIFEKSDALDTLAAHANEHGSVDLQNILDNNEALRNSGVHLTEENVNSVINEVRNHGTAFLSPDGVVHDWTYNGQAVERLADGSFALADSHQPLAVEQLNNVLNHSRESAQQLIDTEVASKTAAEAATVQAAETASKVAAQQQVETFLTQGGNYNHDLFEAAKSSGHLDDLVNRVVDNGNETQTSALVWDYVRDQGWSEDKIRVFMGALRHGDGLDLSSGHFDLHDPQIIAQNMEAFEKSALDSFDRVKDMPAEHWMPARIGDTYFNIQKIHEGIWPLRSDHYLIDSNGDFSLDSINLDDHAMRAAFHRDSFDLGSYKK